MPVCCTLLVGLAATISMTSVSQVHKLILCLLSCLHCFCKLPLGVATVSPQSIDGPMEAPLVEQASDCQQCAILREKKDGTVCIMSPTPSQNAAARDDYMVTCSPSLMCTLDSYFAGGSDNDDGGGANHIAELVIDSPSCDKVPYTSATGFCSEPFCGTVHNPFTEFCSEDGWGVNLPLTNKAHFVAGWKFFTANPWNLTMGSQSPELVCSLDDAGYRASRTSSPPKSPGVAPSCGPRYCSCNLTDVSVSSVDIMTLDGSRLAGLTKVLRLELTYRGIGDVEESAFESMGQLRSLVLSHNDLVALPTGVFRPLRVLTSLNLSYNYLTATTVCGALQDLPALEELLLGYNGISVIDAGCFKGLGSLKVLRLKGNQLRELQSGQFEAQSNLEVLDLSVNKLQALADGTFLNLSDLVHLDLSYNQFKSVPDLVPLSKLARLSLMANRLENITVSDSAILCQLGSLKYLSLRQNRIRTVTPEGFDCPTRLSSLDLGLNLLENLTSVRTANAMAIALDQNRLREFSYGDLPLAVSRLNLSGNSIDAWINDINVTVVGNHRIKTLSLARNQLVGNLMDVQLPASLESLDLSHNGIESVSVSDVFRAADTVIDLRYNRLAYVCNLLMDSKWRSPTAPKYRLDRNLMKCSCELAATQDMSTARPLQKPVDVDGECPPPPRRLPTTSDRYRTSEAGKGLFHCNVTHSGPLCDCNFSDFYAMTICRLPCPRSCSCFVSGGYDVFVVNCSATGHPSLPSMDPIPLPSLIYLSNNSLTFLNATVLSPYVRTRELYLNHNLLRKVDDGAFRQLTNLRILDLSFNNLLTLPNDTFDNCKLLRELYLSRNNLQFLPDGLFRPLARLKVLHLDSNALTSFPVWSLQELRLQGVALGSNPWTCECDYVARFKSWLESSRHVLEDAGELWCTDVPLGGAAAADSVRYRFNESLCVESSPASNDHVPMWICIIVLGVTVFAATILIYRFRQEMQVLIYSRYGLRLFHRRTAAANDDDKSYDVFVAYSSEDAEFVVTELLPGLEQIDNPYRVCIHHRDFLAGALITNNILEAVERSCRTIVVLSQSFVNSGWCRFEFLSAHNTSLYDRVARLIVVVLGDIPQDCDPEMKLYLKTNTYLQWGDRLFWKKLYFALPDKTFYQRTGAGTAVAVSGF